MLTLSHEGVLRDSVEKGCSGSARDLAIHIPTATDPSSPEIHPSIPWTLSVTLFRGCGVGVARYFSLQQPLFPKQSEPSRAPPAFSSWTVTNPRGLLNGRGSTLPAITVSSANHTLTQAPCIFHDLSAKPLLTPPFHLPRQVQEGPLRPARAIMPRVPRRGCRMHHDRQTTTRPRSAPKTRRLA